MNSIVKETLTSVRTLTVILVLGCGLYPVTVYAIGQTAFRFQANGSLVDKDGNPSTPENAAGSRLLGQSFASPGYFHPRPSAAGSGYDAASSSGTNLGPISEKFLNGAVDDPKTKDVDESFAGIKQLVAAYREENGLAPGALVPGDAVTRSASGLDPQISPRNAELQVARAWPRPGAPRRGAEVRQSGSGADPRARLGLVRRARRQCVDAQYRAGQSGFASAGLRPPACSTRSLTRAHQPVLRISQESLLARSPWFKERDRSLHRKRNRSSGADGRRRAHPHDGACKIRETASTLQVTSSEPCVSRSPATP